MGLAQARPNNEIIVILTIFSSAVANSSIELPLLTVPLMSLPLILLLLACTAGAKGKLYVYTLIAKLVEGILAELCRAIAYAIE